MASKGFFERDSLFKRKNTEDMLETYDPQHTYFYYNIQSLHVKYFPGLTFIKQKIKRFVKPYEI